MRPFPATIARAGAGAIVVAVAVSLASSAASTLKGWRDGPAGDMLTDEEYRRFGELSTDEAREAFIEEFWRGVTPHGGVTPAAYRAAFEERARIADERYRIAGREGWKTDRGRILLALGEPSSVRREPGGLTSLEEEVWTYSGANTSDPPRQIVFFRCHDNDYRLDPSCAFQRDGTSVAYDTERQNYIRQLRDQASNSGGGLVTMLDKLLEPVPGGVPVQRPPERSSTRTLVSTPTLPSPTASAPPGVHALEDAAYFFRAQDGSVLTLLTVELLAAREGGPPPAASGGAPPALVGAATVEESGRRGEDLPETSARPVTLDPATEGAAGRASFFGRAYLQPGKTYTVRYAVQDEGRGEIFVKNALVGVPNLNGGFSASSVVPAEKFGPAGDDPAGFQVGSEEVVPKVGGVFRRSDLLRLYLQVYDALVDEATARSRVDVEFRFYRLLKGASKKYGKPFTVRGASGASMGLALPIGDWPPGQYKVVVELHDRVAENRTTAEGSFSIVAD